MACVRAKGPLLGIGLTTGAFVVGGGWSAATQYRSTASASYGATVVFGIGVTGGGEAAQQTPDGGTNPGAPTLAIRIRHNLARQIRAEELRPS